MSARETVLVSVLPSSFSTVSSVYSNISSGSVIVRSIGSLLSASTSTAAIHARQASTTDRLTQKTKYIRPPRQPILPSLRLRIGLKSRSVSGASSSSGIPSSSPECFSGL